MYARKLSVSITKEDVTYSIFFAMLENGCWMLLVFSGEVDLKNRNEYIFG